MAFEDFLKARKEKEAADLDRLRKHREIFLKLNSECSTELLSAAFNRINIWEKNETCSEYYIKEWKKILNDLNLYEKIVLNPKNHHLRQNTPFKMKGL